MGDWGWTEDYVEAIWLMLHQEKPQNFVISTENAISLMDFTDKVFQDFGLEWKQYVEVNDSFKRHTDIRFSKGNSSKAKEILGWAPKNNIDQIIKMLVDFEKNKV
jgi:GDPmannose 4,6-dehydratase